MSHTVDEVNSGHSSRVIFVETFFIQLNGSFGEASTSPKSDAIDSGTDCLAYQSDDEVANEVAMSLCGGLTENNNILGTVLQSKMVRADVPTDELGTVLKRSIRWF